MAMPLLKIGNKIRAEIKNQIARVIFILRISLEKINENNSNTAIKLIVKNRLTGVNI
jgi:hypothetical protein